jgi:cation diffusion facilitator CzcD-associated flavoprotein CzcO
MKLTFTVTSSSAIQILPKIQPVVKNLVNFIRSPTYVWGRDQQNFSTHQIEDLKNSPQKHLAMRKAAETFTNSLYS